MSILKSKRLWWLALFAMLLLIWAVYSSQSAVAQHTQGQLYAVTMDIRAADDDTMRERNGCTEVSKSRKSHGGFTKFGRLADDEGDIKLKGVTLKTASMSLRVDKDDSSSGQLELFLGADLSPSSDAFSTGDIPVTIRSSDGSFTVVPDPLLVLNGGADVNKDLDGIQVEVSKDNKKKKGQKKGQGEPQVVGQITIGDAVFAVPSDGTCDPNDP